MIPAIVITHSSVFIREHYGMWYSWIYNCPANFWLILRVELHRTVEEGVFILRVWKNKMRLPVSHKFNYWTYSCDGLVFLRLKESPGFVGFVREEVWREIVNNIGERDQHDFYPERMWHERCCSFVYWIWSTDSLHITSNLDTYASSLIHEKHFTKTSTCPSIFVSDCACALLCNLFPDTVARKRVRYCFSHTYFFLFYNIKLLVFSSPLSWSCSTSIFRYTPPYDYSIWALCRQFIICETLAQTLN